MRRFSLLFAIILLGCHPRPRIPPATGTVLGWKLAPGMELLYRYRSEYRVGEDVVERSETWRYLVRQADDRGYYELEGRLEALQANILHAGQALNDGSLRAALERERERIGASPVHLALSMDGRLDRLDAGAWPDVLNHRLLALGLPHHAVLAGDRWSDPATARPFSELIPSGEHVQVLGIHELEDLRWIGRREYGGGRSLIHHPHLVAILTTTSAVLPEDARYPALEIAGHAYWDLESGQLERRVLQVQERAGYTNHEGDRFILEAQRLDE